MNLKPSKTSFGRNETFSLRYSWLNKGLKEFKQNENIFLSQDAPLVLGVGKNMVSSIKYWLGAYQILDFSEVPLQTKFGEILEAYDPYLETQFFMVTALEAMHKSKQCNSLLLVF